MLFHVNAVLIVPEVAALLRCSERTVRELARKAELRGSFIAGKWTFDPADVDAFRTQHANRAPERRRRRRAA